MAAEDSPAGAAGAAPAAAAAAPPTWSAATYATYRLGYPDSVFQAMYDFAALQPEQRRLAVDVGCGTGQVAVGLSPTFDCVVGLDSSLTQVEAAAALPNVEYRQAPAEATGLPDGCADLVVAAQCMHWFDVPAFYREVRRILRPHGSLVVFGYMPTRITFPGCPAADEVLNRLHPALHPYFHEHRQNYLLRHYEGKEPTPGDFGVVESKVVDMERRMSVEQIVGWARSFSCWPTYVAAHGEEGKAAVLSTLQQELVAALGVADAQAPVLSSWPLTMICAKQPRPLQALPAA